MMSECERRAEEQRKDLKEASATMETQRAGSAPRLHMGGALSCLSQGAKDRFASISVLASHGGYGDVKVLMGSPLGQTTTTISDSGGRT